MTVQDILDRIDTDMAFCADYQEHAMQARKRGSAYHAGWYKGLCDIRAMVVRLTSTDPLETRRPTDEEVVQAAWANLSIDKPTVTIEDAHRVLAEYLKERE